MKKIFFCISLVLLVVCEVDAQKQPPLVVFVCGDHEYSGEETLPLLAAALEKYYGFRTKIVRSFPNQNTEKNIPGLDILEKADLAVFFLRWRLLPTEQVAYIEAYLKSGKPMMGLRTSTHAFNYSKEDPLFTFNQFAEKAFGAPPGWGASGHTHYGHKSSTDATVIASKKILPILTGVDSNFHVRSWLYKVLPSYPVKGADWLIMGKAVNPDKPAEDQPIAWTWKNEYKARVFFTTMGHPEDFAVEAFQRLLVNAIHWELGLAVPTIWPGKLAINIAYRGIVNAK
jgi:type 1 glutamine amidotransferase